MVAHHPTFNNIIVALAPAPDQATTAPSHDQPDQVAAMREIFEAIEEAFTDRKTREPRRHALAERLGGFLAGFSQDLACVVVL